MAIKEVQVDKNVEQPNKTLDILGYLIFLIPLFTMQNEFDRYHANQATILAIFGIALNVVANILVRIPVLWWLATPILGVLNLCILALMILGMINVNNLECKPLPIIGELFQVIQY